MAVYSSSNGNFSHSSVEKTGHIKRPIVVYDKFSDFIEFSLSPRLQRELCKALYLDLITHNFQEWASSARASNNQDFSKNDLPSSPIDIIKVDEPCSGKIKKSDASMPADHDKLEGEVHKLQQASTKMSNGAFLSSLSISRPASAGPLSTTQVATSYFDPFESTPTTPVQSAKILRRPAENTSRVPSATPVYQKTSTLKPLRQFGPMVGNSHYGGTKPRFTGVSPIEDYVFLDKIGEGTFGEVHRARHRATGRLVALKRILPMPNGEGFPITSLREIKILKKLDHANIVPILEIATGIDQNHMSFYIVFPFIEHDLVGLLDAPNVRLTLPQIKYYAQQLLRGTAYLHEQGLLHRDIKSANILIGNKGELKIADFGLARGVELRPEVRMTPGVVTRWYRPPELLLGADHYSTAVDMWGVGCIIGELFKRDPLFQGNSESHQLTLIFNMVGWPNSTMASLLNLPGSCKVPNLLSGEPVFPHKSMLSPLIGDPSMLDLIMKLLHIDPALRISAKEALEHDVFVTSLPRPSTVTELPHFGTNSYHELAKRRKDAALSTVSTQASDPISTVQKKEPSSSTYKDESDGSSAFWSKPASGDKEWDVPEFDAPTWDVSADSSVDANQIVDYTPIPRPVKGEPQDSRPSSSRRHEPPTRQGQFGRYEHSFPRHDSYYRQYEQYEYNDGGHMRRSYHDQSQITSRSYRESFHRFAPSHRGGGPRLSNHYTQYQHNRSNRPYYPREHDRRTVRRDIPYDNVVPNRPPLGRGDA